MELDAEPETQILKFLCGIQTEKWWEGWGLFETVKRKSMRGGRYKNDSLEDEYDQSYYMYMKTYDFII